MTTDFLWNPGTGNNGLTAAAKTLLADTSELASLAHNTYVVSSVSGASGVFTNNDTGKAVLAELFLTLGSIGSSLNFGADVAGWFLRSYDGGTTYEQIHAVRSKIRNFIATWPTQTITAKLRSGSAQGIINLSADQRYKVGLAQTQTGSGQIGLQNQFQVTQQKYPVLNMQGGLNGCLQANRSGNN